MAAKYPVGSYVVYKKGTWRVTDSYWREWSTEPLYRLLKPKADTSVVAVHIPEHMLKECTE